MVVYGLECDDGGDVEDFIYGGAAGELRGGAIEAEEDLSVGFGACEVLDEFEGDVSGIEVGEDEDVGFSSDGAVGGFDGGDFGDECGVGLEFAIDFGWELLGDEVLAGECGGCDDAVDVFILGAAFCGVGKHGDAGGLTGDLTGEASGFDGDVGELFDGGFGDDGCVCEE